MCFKKKKNKIVIHSKYHLGDFVCFKDKKDGVCPGYIYEVKLNENNEVIYTLQVGGECPSFRYNIKEEEIIK